MKFRKLKASEIDVRVATVKQNGVSLLLYKDARVDQNLLDEVVGAENWQRSHEVIDGNLYCTVSIWDEKKKAWVSKQDVGTESMTEKEKGQASDSFKRACFNWGIGRELYSAPFIWVNTVDCCSIKPGQNGKLQCFDRFSVEDIGYDDDGNVNRLAIMNDSTRRVVFRMGVKEDREPEQKPEAAPKCGKKTTKEKCNEYAASHGLPPTPESTENQPVTQEMINAIGQELERTKIPLEMVLKTYCIPDLPHMTCAMFRSCMSRFKQTKTAEA